MNATIGMNSIRHRAKEAGSHWFDADSMRFFRSRVGSGGYVHEDGRIFFVSSERFVSSTGWSPGRKYSVRVMTPDGNVDTVGEFQQYASRSGADAAARRAAYGPRKVAAALARATGGAR